MTHAMNRPLTRTLTIVALGLAASLLLPLLVHLVPVEAGPPLGARLLAMFYAVLVVALRYGVVPALAVAVAAPLLNHWLTGLPAAAMLPVVLIELSVFALLIVAVRRGLPRLAAYAGPLAYLAAATLARAVLDPGALTLQALSGTIAVAWPGLLMLLAIGVVAASRRPPQARVRA